MHNRQLFSLLLCFLVALPLIAAHLHSDITEDELSAPIDTILYLHIAVQALVWGVLFPVGMLLGIVRSRWHVPVQSLSLLMTAGGYILGHKHGGRMFPASLHGGFANIVLVFLLAQTAIGIYLKLHIHEKTTRPYAVIAHGVIGKLFPILGWCQMLFGAIVLGQYCLDGALGQCLAHYIMGSAFIAYGIIMCILLLAAQGWVKRSKRSPEWWDSWVIFLWGMFNTFTEHHGGAWSHKDLQHTTLGVLCERPQRSSSNWFTLRPALLTYIMVGWTGGALGILLSRRKTRNIIPSIIVIITGWAMSAHSQASQYSSKIHAIFGWTLMSAGATRMVEVCFVVPYLRENSTTGDVSPFQHLPPFLLVAAGLLFMSATDEEIKYIENVGLDHVTYVLILFSTAFVIYSLTVFLLNYYNVVSDGKASNTDRIANPETSTEGYYRIVPDTANLFSGHTLGPAVLRDEEIYELGEHDLEEDPFDDERRLPQTRIV